MENVTKASGKIKNTPKQAAKSPNVDYTHFVSLPLAIHPELVKKLHHFQRSVLEEIKVDADGKMLSKPSTSSGTTQTLSIDRSIFIKPQTFHLTVLMLKLWNKDLVAMAIETLKACMKGSPDKAHVIYAPVEELGVEGRLMRACQVIIDAFVERGLVLQKDAHHSLKLHATLMTTKLRNRKKGARMYDSFDARDIFKRYSSNDWGEYVITEAHLSQRFTFDASGYYHCCASLPFPGNINNEGFFKSVMQAGSSSWNCLK